MGDKKYKLGFREEVLSSGEKRDCPVVLEKNPYLGYVEAVRFDGYIHPEMAKKRAQAVVDMANNGGWE